MDYTYFYKESFDKGELSLETNFDYFLSGFDNSERTKTTFDKVLSKKKIWFNFTQYNTYCTSEEESFSCHSTNEEESFFDFFSKYEINSFSKICIDITGFLKPYLAYLILYLYRERGIKKINLLYSEPLQYEQGELTEFSHSIQKVKLIEGCSPNHVVADTENDILIIAAGYDHLLIKSIANHKDKIKKKYMLVGFPSLQPDMYQEGILKIHKVKETLGSSTFTRFAPAFDPFVTASIIDQIISENPKYSNIYLSPLSTKAQALGMIFYYIWNMKVKPISIIFPYSSFYKPDSSIGIKKTWHYVFELP